VVRRVRRRAPQQQLDDPLGEFAWAHHRRVSRGFSSAGEGGP
jgi:hypothetical protein